MANTGDEYGLFWNSQSGDREYNADSLEIWLKKFFFSGVFNGDLAVTATTGMGISVGSGYANLQGKVMFFGAPTTFTLAAADPDNDRIDTVVVERNDGNREITLKLIQGTPSATPVPVAPVRESGIYQLVLAQILVGSAVSSISQLDITDTRSNSALCGWVASTVSEIDFDSMMAQYTAWFDEFTSHFDADVALELQQEIDGLDERITAVATSTQNFAPIEQTNIASQTYTVGKYLVYNGLLYKVTSAIAQGATLQVGVNIQQTKVGNELNTINNSIGTSIASALEWKYAGTVEDSSGATLKLPTSNYKEILIYNYYTNNGITTVTAAPAILAKQSSGVYNVPFYEGSYNFSAKIDFSANVITNTSNRAKMIYYR